MWIPTCLDFFFTFPASLKATYFTFENYSEITAGTPEDHFCLMKILFLQAIIFDFLKVRKNKQENKE